MLGNNYRCPAALSNCSSPQMSAATLAHEIMNALRLEVKSNLPLALGGVFERVGKGIDGKPVFENPRGRGRNLPRLRSVHSQQAYSCSEAGTGSGSISLPYLNSLASDVDDPSTCGSQDQGGKQVQHHSESSFPAYGETSESIISYGSATTGYDPEIPGSATSAQSTPATLSFVDGSWQFTVPDGPWICRFSARQQSWRCSETATDGEWVVHPPFMDGQPSKIRITVLEREVDDDDDPLTRALTKMGFEQDKQYQDGLTSPCGKGGHHLLHTGEPAEAARAVRSLSDGMDGSSHGIRPQNLEHSLEPSPVWCYPKKKAPVEQPSPLPQPRKEPILDCRLCSCGDHMIIDINRTRRDIQLGPKILKRASVVQKPHPWIAEPQAEKTPQLTPRRLEKSEKLSQRGRNFFSPKKKGIKPFGETSGPCLICHGRGDEAPSEAGAGMRPDLPTGREERLVLLALAASGFLELSEITQHIRSVCDEFTNFKTLKALRALNGTFVEEVTEAVGMRTSMNFWKLKEESITGESESPRWCCVQVLTKLLSGKTTKQDSCN